MIRPFRLMMRASFSFQIALPEIRRGQAPPPDPHALFEVVSANASLRRAIIDQLGALGLRGRGHTGLFELRHAMSVEPSDPDVRTVVLLDVRGFDAGDSRMAGFLEAVRADGRQPLIALTASRRKAPWDELADAVLSKPMRSSTLRRAYDDLAEGSEDPGSERAPASVETVIDRESEALDAKTPSGADLRSILLVEDNEINRRVALSQLRDAGCRVDVATNGVEGLEAARSRRYDLILADVQMPRMDGLEMTRRIRSEEVDRHVRTPIVALTAHALTEDRERCLAAGMDDFVAKPFRGDDLRSVVERFLGAVEV